MSEVQEMTIKAVEEMDGFIFEIMRPYCEKTSGQVIYKKDLAAALERYFKKGRWILKEVGYKEYDLSCSECGKAIHGFQNMTKEEAQESMSKDTYFDYSPNFCSQCGADMREIRNEKR